MLKTIFVPSAVTLMLSTWFLTVWAPWPCANVAEPPKFRLAVEPTPAFHEPVAPLHQTGGTGGAEIGVMVREPVTTPALLVDWVCAIVA